MLFPYHIRCHMTREASMSTLSSELTSIMLFVISPSFCGESCVQWGILLQKGFLEGRKDYFLIYFI